MSEPLLILDTNYLCHRAFHAMGNLNYGSKGTGAVFGVLQDVLSLQERFQTGRVVFAFDWPGKGHRHSILPTYKSSRKARYKEEGEVAQAERKDFYRQIGQLYKDYLPSAGFRNVFALRGFEADDIIAAVAAALPPGDEGIIVSADQDLWQCASTRPAVMCWNPVTGKGVTRVGFMEKWGMEPARWAEVKAIAGCGTDDVPGVPKVGEVTAAKYLRGELGEHLKTYKAIEASAWRDNLPLVGLPYPGLPDYPLVPDEVTAESWQALAERLGMRSLQSTAPRSAPRQSRGRTRAPRQGFFNNE
jgi:DNA polymerase-1